MTLRKALIKARVDKGLTQKELALILGTTQQNISLIETSCRKPTIVMAKTLEGYYGIPMEELFPDIFLEINTTNCNVDM